jgi:hypothetical protein
MKLARKMGLLWREMGRIASLRSRSLRGESWVVLQGQRSHWSLRDTGLSPLLCTPSTGQRNFEAGSIRLSSLTWGLGLSL